MAAGSGGSGGGGRRALLGLAAGQALWLVIVKLQMLIAGSRRSEGAARQHQQNLAPPTAARCIPSRLQIALHHLKSVRPHAAVLSLPAGDEAGERCEGSLILCVFGALRHVVGMGDIKQLRWPALNANGGFELLSRQMRCLSHLLLACFVFSTTIGPPSRKLAAVAEAKAAL